MEAPVRLERADTQARAGPGGNGSGKAATLGRRAECGGLHLLSASGGRVR